VKRDNCGFVEKGPTSDTLTLTLLTERGEGAPSAIWYGCPRMRIDEVHLLPRGVRVTYYIGEHDAWSGPETGPERRDLFIPWLPHKEPEPGVIEPELQ